MNHVVAGRLSEQIAGKFCPKEATVKAQRARVMAKIRARRQRVSART
jgi:FixJ family two-component response regulator